VANLTRARAGLEVQVHPAGSRGRVRYFRLTRAHFTFWSVLALLYLFLLAAAAGMAPGVVEELFGSQEYRSLAAERARQGERLLARVDRLEQLRARSEELRRQVQKIAVAYELGAWPAQAGSGAVAASGPAGGEEEAAAAPGSIYEGAVRQGERLRARIHEQVGAVEAALAEIGRFESAHPGEVRETPAACPLRGNRYVLTNPFGRQRSPFRPDLDFHAGIDLAAPTGTPILAPADGVVTFAGTYPLRRSPALWRYGNLVAVAHGDRYLTLYGHCAELKVAARQAVRRGEVLATVGSSGFSLSPHLHYEVRRRAAGGALAPVDPLLYVLDRRWPDEERLLARAQDPPRDLEPLPQGLEPPAAARRR